MNGDRVHGTHNCYVHGPDRRFTGAGCRCEPCRQANSAYERDRARRVTPAYVGAGEVRRHLAELADAGIGLKTVAQRSGVSHGALSKIVYGHRRADGTTRPPSKRIRVETRDKLLAVTPADAADGAKVPASDVWRTVDRLLERGWTKAAIARAIGQSEVALQLGSRFVTARNARAIHKLLAEPVPPRRSRFGEHPVDEPEPEEKPTTVDPDRWLLPTVRAELPLDVVARAACRFDDVPTWLFFPSRGDNQTVAKAKAVCRTCPVQTECLTVALENNEPGIWGGTSAQERREMRREQVAS